MGTSNDTTNEATEIVDINILPEVDTVPDGKKIMFIDSTDNSGGTIPFEKMRAQIADNATDPIARAQIANLAKLPEGSTTGDAELADIRVGANGKMYDTAGEAVRKQLQENKEQTDEAVASLKEDLDDGLGKQLKAKANKEADKIVTSFTNIYFLNFDNVIKAANDVIVKAKTNDKNANSALKIYITEKIDTNKCNILKII